jgi:hypothetical protein
VHARAYNLVMLGAWTICKARNDAVFNGARVDRALLSVREEAELWMLAGAKGLSTVVAIALPD